MDWQTHDYSSGSAMAYERASPAANPHQQRQVFSYPQQQQQQFDSPTHPFIPPYPSMQPFHYQVHLHAPSSHPQLHHLQQNPSSVYLPHLAPLLVLPPFNGPYDAGSGASPPPPSAPPLDPELHKRIDKLVEYAGKNGPEFEAMLREKQKDSPDYGFLFGGDGHGYYCYKLWLSARGLGGSFTSPSPPSSAHMMRPPPNPVLSPSHLTAPPIIGGPQMLHASYLYEQQRQQRQHPQPFGSYGRPDYDQSSKPFKGLSGPLPADVAVDLSNVLVFLNGTKESIKAAKFWFMQRSIFAPALAESLRDRIYSVDEPERQLHIIYLINDILFESVHRRTGDELDNEALAFKPVLGSMLARIFHNPVIKEESQSKLQLLLQLWASNNIYDPDTINALQKEMIRGELVNSFAGSSTVASADLASVYPQQMANCNFSQWHPERPGSIPIPASSQPASEKAEAHLLPGQTAKRGEKVLPYPLFPPGLIPGMVRKMQIGSGVPYSSMSPLDIPIVIPPSSLTESEVVERVSNFIKETGDVNPFERPLRSEAGDDDDDEYEREYERESSSRKRGACIPPPPKLQVDPETGTYADGSVDHKPGFGSSLRLGLGAATNSEEVTQYDDVYTAYRRQRSSNYHSSVSARTAAR